MPAIGLKIVGTGACLPWCSISSFLQKLFCFLQDATCSCQGLKPQGIVMNRRVTMLEMVELFASRRIPVRGTKYFSEMIDETAERLGYRASLGPDGL